MQRKKIDGIERKKENVVKLEERRVQKRERENRFSASLGSIQAFSRPDVDDKV